MPIYITILSHALFLSNPITIRTISALMMRIDIALCNMHLSPKLRAEGHANNAGGPYARKSALHAPEWKCRLWLPHHLVISLGPSSL